MNTTPPRKPRIGRLMRQIDTIKKLYKQGLSYENIAKQVGTKTDTMCHFIVKQGWKRSRAIYKNSFIPQSDLILKLYKEKHQGILQIANQLGCHYSTVSRILKSKGIDSASSFIESQTKELYDKGLSYKEIGKLLGKTESGICHLVKRRGWTRPVIKKERSTYRTKVNIPKNRTLVVDLYTKKHLNISDIIRQSGFSSNLVKKILIQEGVLNA